jgi:phage terminase large subunit-like protein
MSKKKALDPVTDYATKVATGRIVASKLVHQACARHLADLKTGAARGLVWKPAEAQLGIDFFHDVLCLPERTDADEQVEDDRASNDPIPFTLQPWQAFIVGSVLGWYTARGFRRFREAYIETAKGSGKTPLGAGLMLYLLVADGEPGAQIFAAAVNRDQAKLAFTDAERMVDASAALRELLSRTVNNLAVLDTGSFFRAISSEKRGLDGKRVHGALIDELHEHPTPIVVNKMRAGTKGRRNALIVKTTNSGFDRTSVCWAHHEYSRKVLDGTIENDSWFAFVCGLDPCEKCQAQGKWFPSDDCKDCDSWQHEGPHWLKANPNLGVSLPWQYIRERVSQAKGMPSEVSDVLRFNFCVWTQGASRAVDMGKWAACKALPTDDELLGSPCFGGLDLGETDDLSSSARVWLLDDGRVAVKIRFWIPSAALAKYPNRPYAEWKRAGLLTVTDGERTDYAKVRAQILEDCHADGVEQIGYDTRSATETAQELLGAGIDMVPIPQGFALHEAILRTLDLIVEGDLCHGRHPILSWNASNVVLVTGMKGEKRLAKERAPEKIDGFNAVVNAVELALVRRERVPANVYLSRGVRTLGE